MKGSLKKDYFRCMILVTGGTGLVGSHLLLELVQQHGHVRAIHRSGSNLDGVQKTFGYASDRAEALFGRIEWMEANLNDVPALEKAFDGITEVYHTAAYVSFNPNHFHKLKKSNVEGTANVVNLCLSHGIKKLCFVSSIATLGHAPMGKMADEETAWSWEEENNVYAISKYQAELEVWRGTQEGLTAVIVNPGVILGEGHWHRGSGSIISMAAKGSTYYTPGGVGVVDVKDVVSAMMAVMNSDLRTTRFVLVGHNLTYLELMTELSNALNAQPPTKLAPRWLLNLLSRLDWLKARLTGQPQQLFKASVNSLYSTSFFSSEKIQNQLDFSFTPLGQTTERIGRCWKEG